MTSASYQVQLDINRDSTYAADLTAYVLALEWNHGLAKALDSVAPPARLTMTLDNSGGEFGQETLGAERLTNGNFATWSGGNPTGWTVSGESGSNPEVSEVGPSKSHGGGGNGLANLYTSSATLSISQTILSIGTRYRATLTIDEVSGKGGVVLKNGSTAVSPVYHAPGMKTVYFTATATTFTIATEGAANVTIDNVSVMNSAGMFAGGLRPETLVRVRATFNAVTYTLYTGRITLARLTPGNVGARLCNVVCDDPLHPLAEADYAPPLQTEVTVDAALSMMLDQAIVPWPYAGAYWLLEAEGSSEVGTTTLLFDDVLSSFETAKTTLAFIGDNANRAQGDAGSLTAVPAAAQFIRDLLAAEAGGRLWYDARQGRLTFTSRHHDLSSVTAAAAYSADDYDEAELAAYGDLTVNHVMVHYQPREVGAAESVVWAAPAVIALQPRQTRKLTARYFDAVNNSDARVGGMNMIAPEPYADYTAEVQFAASTDSGVTTNQYIPAKVTLPQNETVFSQSTHLNSDRTRRLGVSVVFGASSAEITLFNPSPSRVFYVTSFQVRGTPLRTFDRRAAESRDGASIRAVGEQKRMLNLPQVDDDDFAQAIADFTISRFKEPIVRLPAVTLIANKSDARMTAVLSRAIGDRITISDDFLGHALDYIVIGEHHKITAGGEHTHVVTWTLEPANTIVYWKLGTSGFGEVGLNTRVML